MKRLFDYAVSPVSATNLVDDRLVDQTTTYRRALVYRSITNIGLRSNDFDSRTETMNRQANRR